METMQIVCKNTAMYKGAVRTFETEKGFLFGLKVIGDANSHNRFKTPDGKRFRSIKTARAYLEAQAREKLAEKVKNLASAWKCKVSVAV